jgi:hypothetical protein
MARPLNPSAPLPDHLRRYDITTIGLLLLAATVYLAYPHLWAFKWQLKAHTRFVPVPAVIVESTLRSTHEVETPDLEMYQPNIVFRYRVDGHDHESDRVYFGSGGWRDRAAAQAVVEQYPAGHRVTAYVDEDERTMAVLDRRRPDAGALLYLLPMTALSLAALSYGMHKRTRM